MLFLLYSTMWPYFNERLLTGKNKIIANLQDTPLTELKLSSFFYDNYAVDKPALSYTLLYELSNA